MKRIFGILMILILLGNFSVHAVDTLDDIDKYSDGDVVYISSPTGGYIAEVDSDGYLKVNVVGGITVGDITTDTNITSLIPGTAATEIGKAEDAVHASSDTGVAFWGVRNDTLAALAGADGDYGPVQLDADGSVYTTNPAIYDEDAAHTTADEAIAVLGVRNDVLAALAGADGDYTVAQYNDIGALFTTGEHAEDAAHVTADYGDLVLAVRNDALASLSGTDGDLSVLQVGANGALFVRVAGSAAADLGKAEDAAHSSGDVGVLGIGVRNDVLAALAGTDGDNAPVQISAAGAVFMTGDVLEDAAHSSGCYGLTTFAVRNDVLAALGGADGDNSPYQVNDIGALFTTGEHKEDAAHASGDYGNLIMTVRNDALEALSGTDADISVVQTGAEGAVFVMGDQVEDSAAGDGDYGFASLFVRNDVLAALGGADGDYATPQVNDIGALFTTGEHVEDAAHASGDYGNQILVVRNDTLAALGGTDGDYVPPQANAAGAIFVTQRTNTISIDESNGAAAGGLTILAAGAGGIKNRIYSIVLTSDATQTMTLDDGFGVYYMVAGMPVTLDYGDGGKLQNTAATAITVTSGGAANVGALVQYSQE